MGNTLGGKKTAKIMKINGETMKFKTPVTAREVVKDYPGHVILDSEAVKHYGIRAKPLDPFQNLEPKRLYFLVELPKFPQQGGGAHHEHRVPRRVRSGIHMSAKDRLESLMLSRRSVSDLSIMGPATRVVVDGSHDGAVPNSDQGLGSPGSGLRVRMRLPKAEVERLMSQSRDKNEAAEKIVGLCTGKTGQDSTGSSVSMNSGSGSGGGGGWKGKEVAFANSNTNLLNPSPLGPSNGTRGRPGYKKRVGFLPIHEGEMGLAVAS